MERPSTTAEAKNNWKMHQNNAQSPFQKSDFTLCAAVKFNHFRSFRTDGRSIRPIRLTGVSIMVIVIHFGGVLCWWATPSVDRMSAFDRFGVFPLLSHSCTTSFPLYLSLFLHPDNFRSGSQVHSILRLRTESMFVECNVQCAVCYNTQFNIYSCHDKRAKRKNCIYHSRISGILNINFDINFNNNAVLSNAMWAAMNEYCVCLGLYFERFFQFAINVESDARI